MKEDIVWKDEYLTGNPLVDREHRELVNLVNLLSAAAAGEDSGSAFEDSFSALDRYVERHFKNEEDLLDAVDSPYLERQRTQHAMLARELHMLWSGGKGAPRGKVVHGLAEWSRHRLLSHLLTTDLEAFNDFPFSEDKE
jgi:hemerythrin-like metal-binding protein